MDPNGDASLAQALNDQTLVIDGAGYGLTSAGRPASRSIATPAAAAT